MTATPSPDWPLWEVFVRARRGLSHQHVGSLHAADAEMALRNARDTYTRRQEGVSIWVVPSAQITALGTERGLDTELIPARGYPLELIPPVPLSRKLDQALLQTPAKLRASIKAARAVLQRTRAEIVVGFGGYVAMPAYLAARKQGIPFVLHEAMPTERWVGFGLVWLALIVLSIDLIVTGRARRASALPA